MRCGGPGSSPRASPRARRRTPCSTWPSTWPPGAAPGSEPSSALPRLPEGPVDHVEDRLGPGLEPQLGEQARDLAADVVFRLPHGVGDLVIGETVGRQVQDALVSLGKPLEELVPVRVVHFSRALHMDVMREAPPPAQTRQWPCPRGRDLPPSCGNCSVYLGQGYPEIAPPARATKAIR